MENEKQQKNKKGFKLNVPTAIIVAGLFIAIAVALPKVSPASDEHSVNTQATVVNSLLLNEVDENDHIKGAENPTITLVEFSDFGCHFCGVFHPTVEALLEEYPNDLAWVYRHLPFRNKPASIASECVADLAGNDAFWTFTNNLFENQSSINTSYIQEEALALGISELDFQACLDGSEAEERVDEDFSEARLIGARGTPHSVIVTSEGREFPIQGAMDIDNLRNVIETILSE